MPDATPIRLARATDRQAVVELWVELVGHHRGLDPDYPRRPAGPKLREGLLEEFERGLRDGSCVILVAGHDATIQGFVFAELEAGPGSVAWIHELFIHPAARRLGLGRQLVEAALDELAGSRPERIAVRVEVPNREGRKFWEALAFRERALILERRQ